MKMILLLSGIAALLYRSPLSGEGGTQGAEPDPGADPSTIFDHYSGKMTADELSGLQAVTIADLKTGLAYKVADPVGTAGDGNKLYVLRDRVISGDAIMANMQKAYDDIVAGRAFFAPEVPVMNVEEGVELEDAGDEVEVQGTGKVLTGPAAVAAHTEGSLTDGTEAAAILGNNGNDAALSAAGGRAPEPEAETGVQGQQETGEQPPASNTEPLQQPPAGDASQDVTTTTTTESPTTTTTTEKPKRKEKKKEDEGKEENQ